MGRKLGILLFGISVFAGSGYFIFTKTSIGKKTLSNWLLKRWSVIAGRNKQKRDFKQLEEGLKGLDYEELELLVKITWSDPINEKRNKNLSESELRRLMAKQRDYYDELQRTSISKKLNLKELENVIFTG